MFLFKQRLLLQYLLLLVICLYSSIVSGQPPISEVVPSEMSPNQVDPKTMSQTQLSSLLSDKNKENTGKDRTEEFTNRNRLDKDSVIKDNIRLNSYSKEATYGQNIFSNAATTDLSELSTPPLDYPIGVGDNIIVSLWGGAEFQESYIVARDGAIFPNSLGKISVQGLTFENVRNIVYARFKSVVPPGTNIAVSLGQPRSINVNVVGNVEGPGITTVSAFANVFTVIARAGGVNQFGDLRSIQLKRAGRVIDEIDVYKYLTTGDFGKHVYLQNNDFVIVGPVQKKVLATGQFKRPMYYQLKNSEGVKALLNYTGGLTSDALASGMKVLRSFNEQQVQRDVNANAIMKIAGEDFMLEDGDIVKVDIIKAGISNKVELRGEVTYPATYELRKGERLFDLINRAGGVTRNTYLPRAYIFRGAGDSTNLQSDRLEVNLLELNKNDSNSISNVTLLANDVVQLFSQGEFGEQQFVEIYGEVRKEGKVRKYGGMSLQDLLYLSGGIKPSAEFGRLEISSIVDMDSAQQGLKPTRTVVKSYAIQPNLQVDSAASDILLKPYDQIYVRKNPTFELQQNIELKGLVKYPGPYPRLDKYERLSSYIQRAGGIRENANLSGALLFRKKKDIFKREELLKVKPKFDSLGFPMVDSLQLLLDSNSVTEEPVSIELAKALKNRGSKHDIILQEDDIIVIPEIDPFVSVEGTVQSPLKMTFDKEHTNLLYYIDKAGGYGVRPWRSRIYVTYANGKSRRTKNFGFFHFYPKVEQGSIVTVPLKPQGQELLDIIKSSLLTLVPVFVTGLILKNVN